MTDARDIYARAWGRSHLFDWEGQCEDTRNDWQYYVDSICAALNITPRAISALMDGTATVVPVEVDEDGPEETAFWTAYGEYKQLVVDGVFPRPTLFHHMRDSMLAASPYRRKDDAG